MNSTRTFGDSIRIFISSTFIDMQVERDQLVKKVFPILRAYCEKAGITFTEVDLRWGITNEEAAEGKVLSICLEEIEQCRPFFIGILGDRYGWVPDSLPEDLCASEPWLVRESEKSVTELEILNGVLNNPDMADHAFFYFRQPGPDAAEAKDAEKLNQLKDRIRASGFPLKEGFSSPEELGSWIEADLKEAIAPHIEIIQKQDAIERAEMDARANLKIQSTFHIKQDDQFEKLDHFLNQADDGNSILLFEGEAGIGKYSTLSNWYLQTEGQNNAHRVIFYPTRAGGDFSDVDFMFRFLTHQLQGRSPDFQPPSQDADRYVLIGHFLDALKRTVNTTPCTIIIPDIDQLSDAQTGRGTIWLPAQLPDGVKIIVSASDPAIIQDFAIRPFERLLGKKLTTEKIERFVLRFLDQYRKKLSPALIKSISEVPLASLPINLMIILEELRIFGNHERLEETLEGYLTATDTKSLFKKVLARWEDDFNPVCPDMVKKTLTCIFMTVMGHSETELRTILGDGSPVPHAHWAPLYQAMAKWTVRIKGNLKIVNKAFQGAVYEKFLMETDCGIIAHQLTARYFLDRLQNNKPGAREFTELPYALFHGRDYPGFLEFYGNRQTLKDAWKFSPSLLTQYFALPEKFGAGHFLDIMDKEISDGGDYTRLLNEDADYLIAFAEILQTMGRNEDAIVFWNMIAGFGQQNNIDDQFEKGVSNLANLKMSSGEVDKAIDMYNHLLQHYEQKSDQDGINSISVNLGLCHQTRGENETALGYFEKSACFFERERNMPNLLIALHNCSNTLERLKRYEEAEDILSQAEIICRQLGDNVSLAEIFDEKATLLRIRKRLDEALELHDLAVGIFSQLNHVDKHVISLSLRGATHMEMLNITEGIRDYLFSLQRCIGGGMKQSQNEILRMLEESMKWNVAVWLGTDHGEIVEGVLQELSDFRTYEEGLFEAAVEVFQEVMEKSITFAIALRDEQE